MSELVIEFKIENITSSIVRQTFSEAFEWGCTTERDGGNNLGVYAGISNEFGFVETETEKAVNEMEERMCGTLKFWCGDMAVLLTINPPGTHESYEGIMIMANSIYFNSDTYSLDNSAEVQSNIECILDLTERLYQKINPDYAYGIDDYINISEKQLPCDEDILGGTLNALAWLTILPESVVREIGRERILTAPVADVRAFGDDLALVLTDQPVPYYHDAFQAVAAAVKEHLRR